MKFDIPKPNKAQKVFLLVGLSAAAIAVVYFKFFATPTVVAPAPSTATPTNFTGAYDCYTKEYNNADGSGNAAKCGNLMKALSAIRLALNNSSSLAPSQITNLKGQEMAVLAELQKFGCPNS